MFCSNCGIKLPDGANFCSACGARVTPPAVMMDGGRACGGADALPPGMTRTPDGKVWWSFIEKKREVKCYLDEEMIAVMHEVERKKERSVLGSLLLDAAELVAMNGDNYPSVSLPSELEGDTPAPTIMLGDKEYNCFMLRFRYMSSIKEDRKNGVIKIPYSSCRWTLCLTPEQYDFVLGHILKHCPNIRRK